MYPSQHEADEPFRNNNRLMNIILVILAIQFVAGLLATGCP